MLTSKKRAQLRAEANGLPVIVHIGKDGINENLIKQAKDALFARELIKLKVLESAMLTAREACDTMAELTKSEQVQVIGSCFVLYRLNPEKHILKKTVPVKPVIKKPDNKEKRKDFKKPYAGKKISAVNKKGRKK